VLSSLGGLRYRQDDDDAAIALYRRAIEVLQAGHGPDYAELGTLYLNVAGPEEERGDFDAALRDFGHATAIIRKTYGPQHGHFLGAAADQARLLHRRGQRQQADEVFEGLLKSSPADPAVYRNAVLAQTAAVIREDYGECLVSEGRPQRAVAVLKAALGIFESAALFSDYRDAFAVHLGLGNAYLALGRLNDARGELVPLVRKLAASKAADSTLLLNAREALGRLELQSGNERAARNEFNQVLTASGGKPTGAVARAYADLAGVALARNDVTAASELSGNAVAAADAAKTEPDVRLHPFVWDTRARALLRAGDAVAAARLSEQAMTADRIYFDPASSELANAARTAQLIDAAQAASVRSSSP
jgi:tetratricopeptide (TPR) repeat protein